MKRLAFLMRRSRNPLPVKVWSRSLAVRKQHVSASWAALTVVALGVLVVFHMGCDRVFDIEEVGPPIYPNYYTCDCDCSRRVIADPGAAVYTSPGGLFIDFLPASNNNLGSILDGPVDHDFNGNPATWWQVQFDTGVEATSGKGWVFQSVLTVANETLVTKEAQACLPAEFNQNLGGSEPIFGDLQAVCGGDVAREAQVAIGELLAPLGRFLCQCSAEGVVIASNHNSSCDNPCPNGADVCLLMGSDPPDPTPEPVSAALFQPTSVCEVAGPVTISVKGHAPKTQPTAQGALQVRGRPCPPDDGCQVGMSYQLMSTDIEFDSDTIFASDPKFVDLSLSGATEPDVINMGPILGFYLGEVPAGTALSSAHGRRSGSTDAFGMDGRNIEGLALAMNWAAKTCRIAGNNLVGGAVGDGDEGELDVQVDVALDGTIVNQPPRPDAGADQTVECTSSNGADVTLDASGSTDADNNIAFYEWRSGSNTGPQITAPSSNFVVQTHQALGPVTYYVRVVDSWFAADGDSVGVSVADTTAPEIFCNAPATIVPSDVPENPRKGILSYTATATDSCTGVSAVVLESFSCTKPQSCKVGIQGATITIFDSGGIGDIIRWTVSAQDAAGNESQKTCELSVVKKK